MLILNNLETALKLCIFDGLFRLECNLAALFWFVMGRGKPHRLKPVLQKKNASWKLAVRKWTITYKVV